MNFMWLLPGPLFAFFWWRERRLLQRARSEALLRKLEITNAVLSIALGVTEQSIVRGLETRQ